MNDNLELNEFDEESISNEEFMNTEEELMRL